MADLTIGQRIAQERKKLELSQIALAARMDVSRQAISKWESDAAIPEIDKLIALSRLFHVSIGWLLGVEEQPVSREESLSEEQFKIVEELVKKYQTPPKPHLTVFHYLLAFGMSLLIFLFLYGITSRLEKQILMYEANITALDRRLEALEAAAGSGPVLSADALLASYTLTPSAPMIEESSHTGLGTSYINLNAIPNIWNPGDEGWLHIRNTAGETQELQCLWNGTALTATVELPVEDGYVYSFVVRHEDGSQETQILSEETAQDLQSTFHIPGVHETGTIEYRDGTLILKGYTSTLTMPELYQQERFDEPGYYADPYPAAWQKAEYVLLVNDSVSGAAYYHLPVMDSSEGLPLEDAVAYTLTTAEPELRFENIQVSDTTMHAQLWLYAYLDNGLRERYLLDMFEYSQENGFTELS